MLVLSAIIVTFVSLPVIRLARRAAVGADLDGRGARPGRTSTRVLRFSGVFPGRPRRPVAMGGVRGQVERAGAVYRLGAAVRDDGRRRLARFSAGGTSGGR